MHKLDKKIKRLYIAEAVALLISLVLFLLPRAHYTYSGDTFSSEQGVLMESLFDVAEPGYYIDNSMAGSEEEQVDIVSPETNLHLGTYEVRLKYLTDSHNNLYTCSSKYSTFPVITKRMGEGLDEKESGDAGAMVISLDTPHKVDGYRVTFNYTGNGYLYVYGLEIVETMWWKWRALFTVIFISILVNLMVYTYVKKEEKARWIIPAILGISFFATLPFTGVAVFGGHDFGFHLGRIEALRIGIENGQFPVRISPYWINGKGYAASIFYCDFFLLPAAIMRILGSTVQEALVFYIAMINLATSAISYWSFKKISGTRLGAMLGVALYVLSPYRLSNIFTRAAMGEYTGLVFVPLVFAGLYVIYHEEVPENDTLLTRFRRVLPLVLGLAGIAMCHVLTGVMVAIMGIIIVLVNWKKTFKKRVLLDFGMAALMVLLLSLWYLVPFVQIYKSGIKAGSAYLNGRFRSNGALLWQLFSLFPYTGMSMSVEEGFVLGQNLEMSFSGGVGMLVLVLYALLRFGGVIKASGECEKQVKLADKAAWISALTLWMATIYFPWDLIKQSSYFMLLVTLNIQFPWRFLGMSMAFLAILGGLVVSIGFKKGITFANYGRVFALVTAFMVVLSASYYFTEICKNQEEWLYLVDEDEGASPDIMGGEYLPEGAHSEYYELFNEPVISGGSITSVRKDKGLAIYGIDNAGGSEATLTVPYLYYVGYKARDVQHGTVFELGRDENAFVTVTIPAGYTGDVGVYYSEPVAWRVCELVSVLAAVAVLIMIFKIRRRDAEQ